MKEAAVVMTTVNTDREAKKMALELVKGRLAAGVQILPKMQSIYEWEGEIHDEQEYLLIIITREELIDDLKKFIKKNHSYEVPELLVLPAIDGADDYLKWIADVTK